MRESAAVSGDIELDISRGPGLGQYVVRVLQAPAGTSAPSSFELDVDSLLADRVFLESVVLASAVRSRRSMPLEERQIQKVGQTLFGALFSREIYGTYRASLAAAHQSGHQLRVVLTLSAPELAALPWEALYDPETETYLCRTEPLVRCISAPAFHLTPLRIERPLRVLGIVSDPVDLPPLDAAAERQNLEQALAGWIAAGQIEIVWVTTPTWSNIHGALLNGPWHVIHFIGHGEFNGHADEGQLVLIDREGNADSVEANRLVDLLSTARPIPRLVVLNSCSSGETGAQDLFSSTAAALVRGGIHAVTAMQFAISDEGAIAFAQGFYSALAAGRSVDEAARNGRIAIRRAGGSLEWITPVLYVRQGPTQLFTLPATTHEIGSWQSPEPRTVKPVLAEEDLHATYVRAQAELRVKNYGAAVALLDEVLQRDPGYRDAAALHAEAARINQPIEAYEKALTAESIGDFAEAERLYSVVLSVDPGFRDAQERQQKCNTRQRINDLQAEIRVHASSERWQAVLDVNAELQSLDPAAADPDGMATHAQMEISWAEAVRDEAAGHLDRPFKAYSDIMEKNPHFRDVSERCQALERKLVRRSNLEGQMEVSAHLEQWQIVLDAFAQWEAMSPAVAYTRIDDQIIRLLPESSPYRLALRARQEITRIEAIKAAVQTAVEATTGTDPSRAVVLTGVRNAESKKAIRPRSPYFMEDDGRQALLRIVRDDLLLYIQAKTEGSEATDLPTPEPGPNGDQTPLPGGIVARSGKTVTHHRTEESHSGMRLELLSTRSFEAAVTAICLSPDGALMATSHKTIRRKDSTFIWDVASGKKLQTLQSGFTSLDALTFSADSRWIGGIHLNTARVFSVITGNQRAKVKTKFLTTFEAIAFSPDGQRFSTIDSDGSSVIWSIFTGRSEAKHRQPINVLVSAAVFAADAARVVTTNKFRNVADFWDITTGHRINGSLIAKSPHTVIAVSPDGERFATINREGNPTINGGPDRLCLSYPVGTGVKSLAFSKDGSRLAVADDKKRVCIWETATGELLLGQRGIDVDHMVFNPDGTNLVVAHAEKLTQWSILSA